jgi:protein-S-isoprenylcysteine O-methyltransferase Ste14
MVGSPDNPGVIAPPPLVYLGALLIVLACRALMPLPIVAGRSMLWPGLVLIAGAVSLALWGRRTMLNAGTNVRPTLPATAIVSSGPFHFSRNPLYCSLTLLFLGFTALLNTWWGIVVLAPLLLTMHFGVIRREERYLEGKFGEQYRRYRGSVRRYL